MDILMPQLGETVAEGTIISWAKAVGDVIAAGETLFEVETDKVTMDVPCMTAGVLTAIKLPAGETALVGSVVAVIDGPSDGSASAPAFVSAPVPVPAAPSVPPAPVAATALPAGPIDPFRGVRSPERNFGPAKLASGVRVTPLARRLAAQGSIDLAGLTGSGPGGRITAADVRGAPASVAPTSSSPAAEPTRSADLPDPARERDDVLALYADTPFEELPLDGMRTTIARRLVLAKQTIPHFYLSCEVDLERLLALRQQLNETVRDVRISVNDFVVKGFAAALRAVPAANAVWAGDRILRLGRVDLGVAVAVEGGLFTPVVRGADTVSLSAVSRAIKDLAGRAKERRLKPAEYQGGTATVSNLGMYGTREFAAIINPPQSSILAVGAAERRPYEGLDGEVRFGSRMTVTLSCDHRVIDGAVGAELLANFKRVIEQPLELLV